MSTKSLTILYKRVKCILEQLDSPDPHCRCSNKDDMLAAGVSVPGCCVPGISPLYHLEIPGLFFFIWAPNRRVLFQVVVGHANVGVSFCDLRLSLKNPRMLLDFLEILSMCVFQDRLSVHVGQHTGTSIVVSSVFRMCPFSV